MPKDKGTILPITQLNGLQINYTDKNSCFNPPIVTKEERNALVNTTDSAKPIKNGTEVFNSDEASESQEYYVNGIWYRNLAAAVTQENGEDVDNPFTENNIPIFADAQGTLADSSVSISQVDAPEALKQKHSNKSTPKATTVNQIGNLGAIQFGNTADRLDIGSVLLNDLTAYQVQRQEIVGTERICTIFSGELPEGSSSPSAIVEINSTIGGLLHARMNTTQRDALITPVAGLVIYNTDIGMFQGFGGTGWQTLLDTSSQIGMIIDTAAQYLDSSNNVTTPPYGYLWADGAEISRTIYDKLFAVISTGWGEGDGSTTFNLPNLLEVFRRGASSNLSSSALQNRYSINGGTGNGVGTYQGGVVQSHTHPANNHSVPNHTHSTSWSTSGGTILTSDENGNANNLIVTGANIAPTYTSLPSSWTSNVNVVVGSGGGATLTHTILTNDASALENRPNNAMVGILIRAY